MKPYAKYRRCKCESCKSSKAHKKADKHSERTANKYTGSTFESWLKYEGIELKAGR